MLHFFQTINLKMLLAILLGVATVGFIFIRRALQHRKGMEEDSSDHDSPSFYELEPSNSNERSNYLLRFICMRGITIKEAKYVRIRLNYYQAIKFITNSIGKSEISISEYVDNVLTDHLSAHTDTINELHKESLEEVIKPK